jgi:hypothetical protein
MNKQEFFWYKDQTLIPANAIIGSVANGMYVLAREYGDLFADLYVKDSATPAESVLLGAGSLQYGDIGPLCAENDSGVTVMLWRKYPDYWFSKITLVGGALNIVTHPITFPDTPRNVFVTSDGLEFVVHYGYNNDATVVGYNFDGDLLWSDNPWDSTGPQRTEGYVVGAPRQGRYLFVSTPIPTYPISISGTFTSDISGPGPWGLTAYYNFDVPDLTGLTVVSGTWVTRVNWGSLFINPPGPAYGGVFEGYITMNGDTIADPIVYSSWTNQGFGGPVVTFLTGGTITNIAVVTQPYDGSVVGGSTWYPEMAVYIIDIDNSAAHTGTLQLRGGAGLIDYITYVEDWETARWVGTGVNKATYFNGSRIP